MVRWLALARPGRLELELHGSGSPGEAGSVGAGRHGVHLARWGCLEAFPPLPGCRVPISWGVSP